MGMNTGIEWTDHTLNFWWGCLKVSPGCTNCYAETFSKRVGRNIWGPPQTSERWRTKGPWQDCLKWDKQARRDGVRRKVFCQSMSDFFEDHPQVEPWREEAIKILERLEWLDVQLLTKRPENVTRMVPDSWLENWPAHIWMGTSVENQEYANKRIPELLKIPAAVRFLSVEPLLGPVDLWSAKYPWPNGGAGLGSAFAWGQGINWVIVGGESGHGARPMHPEWVRKIRDECQAAGVAFFFKQWGEYVGGLGQRINWVGLQNGAYICGDKNTYEWGEGVISQRVGKHAAGRLLDGLTWDEFPQPQQADQLELL